MGSSKKPQDATRQERKARKRKLEDAVPDLPGEPDETAVADIEVEKSGKKRKRDVEEDVSDEKEKKERKKDKKRKKKEAGEAAGEIEGGEAVNGDGEGGKKEKKSKKDKKGKDSATAQPAIEVELETVAEEAGPKKSKKERKAERKAAEAAAAEKSKNVPVEDLKAKPDGTTNGEASTNGDSAEAKKASKKNNRNREKKRKGTAAGEEGAVEGDAEKSAAEAKEKKDARFICFIGNLPFTANTASITKHFAAVKPISIRALTQKDNPTKSKGIAFIEFEGYDHMKTCLKMFHHSTFDDGLSAPRRINVELTAGGGGNTKERKGKIQEKNSKLNEQRVRRIQEEEKAKIEKSSNEAAIDESAIHPSRRARVPGA